MQALELLNSYYRKKKLRGYSLRALARDLKVSPAFVSNILKGKKKVPPALIPELSRRLDIDSETALEITRQLSPQTVSVKSSFKSPTASNHWEAEDKKSLSALRQWFYVAILELITCSDFDGSSKMISRRLGLSLASVEVAVRELQALGLLTIKSGKIHKTKKHIKISSAKSIQEIRGFHRQMLKKADEELSETSPEAFERRLIAGITISADPAKIQIAKKMLSDALHEVANFLSEEPGSEVYHLAGQLFPITKSK